LGQGPFDLFTGICIKLYLDDDEEAFWKPSYIANDIQSFAGAFSSVDDEAVLKLCLDKMPVRSDRSKVIMSWFASFLDEYDFTEDDAARIGLFVASAALPIADVVDLIDHLRGEEDEAEGADWINTQGCLCTVATLRAWARAASFPTQWPAQARTSMFVALSRWSATNAAADVAFEGRVAKSLCHACGLVIAAARGGASRLCPWRGGETLSLSVTLHEEIEPSKGTAKRAHGLVRLALDISKA
jgi:hypothetical protein